jgi:hypothetical protein
VPSPRRKHTRFAFSPRNMHGRIGSLYILLPSHCVHLLPRTSWPDHARHQQRHVHRLRKAQRRHRSCPRRVRQIKPKTHQGLRRSVASLPSLAHGQQADTQSPPAKQKRKEAIHRSENEAETPRKAKLRKIEILEVKLPGSAQQDLCTADTVIGLEKGKSAPLFRSPSPEVAEGNSANCDREETYAKSSASWSPSDPSPSTKEHIHAKLSTSIKREEDCTSCAAYIKSLEVEFQVYTAVLRKEGVYADFFSLLAELHQQMLETVSVVHRANHATVKAE